MRIHSITHQGYVRQNNEDRLLAKERLPGLALLALADGMGGHAAGERAAEIAVGVLDGLTWEEPGSASPERLLEVFRRAQKAVLQASLAEPKLGGMGTTLTAAIVADGRAFWASIGDSRLYLFRRGVLTQVTRDHTIPGALLQEGKITREQARVHPLGNVLLQCVGCQRFEPDSGAFEVEEGDLLLLSSDGMHDMLPDGTIASILGSAEDLEHKLELLVRASLESGGHDNISVVGAQI